MVVNFINAVLCLLLLWHDTMLVPVRGCVLYTCANPTVALLIAGATRRMLGGLHDRMLPEGHNIHDTVITSNEMDTILQNCIDTNYDVALYSSLDDFHFFIGIMVTKTTTTVDEKENTGMCVPVPLGFESSNGDKLVVRTTTDNDDDDDDFDGYQKHNFGSYKLGDIIEAFNQVDAIPVNEYNKITNNCVHFAQNIWRNLQVTEDPTLHSFLVSSIVNHNYFMDYAREHIGLSPFLSNILFGSKNTKIPAHYISYVKGYIASQLIMDNDVISVNPMDENDVYFYDPKPNVESLLKLLDGRKLVDSHCDDKTYNADAVIIAYDDGGIFVGMVLEPIIDTKDDDAGSCPWYLISTETDDDGSFVKSFSPLEEKLSSFDTVFHEKSMFLTHSVGNYPLRTLMKSFDTASMVGTDLPEDAKYDLVDNHGAELTCNIVTDLGIKVDDDVIAMIKSSIRVGALTFSKAIESEGSTLTDVILDCLGEPKSSKKKSKSPKNHIR